MTFFDEPEVPAPSRAEAVCALRYEDVSQDGRLTLLALPPVLGPALWQTRMVHDPLARALHREGVVPILDRFVIEGGEGPVSVSRPLAVAGRYDLAHTVDERGAVDRILLRMWAQATAPRARTHGAQPAGEGEPIFAGRVYAEHVFTRPFAPPAERKVLRLDYADGAPAVPERRISWRSPDAVLVPPPGAVALDPAPLADEAPVVFGLHHTDSNQHVNSLVYPRLFQDAALRRFAARGEDPRLSARALEIAYRKPCFAGERVCIF